MSEFASEPNAASIEEAEHLRTGETETEIIPAVDPAGGDGEAADLRLEHSGSDDLDAADPPA